MKPPNPREGCALRHVVACAALFWSSLGGVAAAQSTGVRVDAWGQSRLSAGLLNMEARVRSYPWVRAETQVWVGRSPLAQRSTGDIVVLAAQLSEPGGRLRARAGRFVLTTGAVRPVHLDGAHLWARAPTDTRLELFGGVPVLPGFAARGYDWLVGARLSQRVGRWGSVGASYVQRRDRGDKADEEVGVDWAAFPAERLNLNGRLSYDLATGGLSEVQASASYGDAERRAELFGSLRDAARVLPATSLFSVLSDAPSLQAGVSGRWLVAPRLRLRALAGYRGLDDQHGVRASLGAVLWLDGDRDGSLLGEITRDGLPGQQWWGARARLSRGLWGGLRLLAEVELVRPDDPAGRGALWPWGRLSARYRFLEDWQLSAGVEGQASPQLSQLWQGLVRVAYMRGAT